MKLQSLEFLLFLAVTLAVCLPVGRRSRAAGTWLLLAASVVFYGPKGLAVLVGLGVFAQWTAWRIRREERPGRRKAAFFGGVCVLTGVLVLAKYLPFFTGGRVAGASAPLGLSFFTFQQLWYLKEVYDGRIAPAGSRDYALYALFFPTVVSGPILKPQSFFPQLTGPRFLRPDWRDASAGLYAIACGTIKKVLLADAFGAVADAGWAAAGSLSATAAWLTIVGYTLQLYFDFSGYCDVAAGTARLLGLRLPVNFNSPYRALSVGEFWKRWHITLTSFLRESVYFPLGGSRCGAGRTYRNILIVFLVSGLWHGAGWTFLIWGGLHGLAQVTERIWGTRRERLPKVVRWGLTFLFVNVAWVFFRAPSLSAAGALLGDAVSGGLGAGAALTANLFSTETQAVLAVAPVLRPIFAPMLLAALYGAGLAAALAPGNTITRMETFRPTAARCVVLAGLLAWAVLSFNGVATFLYTNF